MSHKVMIGRYYSINSRIHNMNPLAKMICMILFIIMIFLTNDLRLNLLIAFLLGIMILNTNIPTNIYHRVVYNFRFLLLLVFIINLILGQTLQMTIISLLRCCYVVIYISIITLTTPPSEIIYAIEKLLFPLRLFRFPVKKIALFISNLIRLIPNLMDNSNKIKKSQASRGIDYNHSKIKGKILSIKTLIGPTVSMTVRKNRQLNEFMKARLYDSKNKRINFRQNKWGFYDTFLVLFHITLFILVVKGVVQ